MASALKNEQGRAAAAEAAMLLQTDKRTDTARPDGANSKVCAKVVVDPRMCVCIFVCVCIYMYVSVYMYVYIYVYTYTLHIYTYIFIYI